jgi:membrane fusion protein (multidrug efflux system)
MAGVIAMMQTSSRRPAPAPAPKAAAPAPSAAPAEITLPGKIQAKNIVNIVAPTEGIVERFLADAGEDVFEGEVLATIKNPRLQARAQATEGEAIKARSHVSELESSQLESRLEASRSRADATRTKAELERSQKVYERQKLLYQEGATARLTYEKAEAEYKQLLADTENFERVAGAAEARIGSLTKELESARVLAQKRMEDMDSAKADLGAGEVHSPVDGVVISRHGKAGEAVTSDTDDLFIIGTNLTDLEVVLKPEAAVLAKLKVGAAVTIDAPEAPGPIQGTLREIKDGEVFIDFKSPLPAIKPGMTAQVKFKL